MKGFKPLSDRILVKHLPSAGPQPRVELIRLKEPTCLDAVSPEGDYRRLMIRAKVVAVGPGRLDEDNSLVPIEVRPGAVVFCSHWDDLEGRIKGHALIREADIALIET